MDFSSITETFGFRILQFNAQPNYLFIYGERIQANSPQTGSTNLEDCTSLLTITNISTVGAYNVEIFT